MVFLWFNHHKTTKRLQRQHRRSQGFQVAATAAERSAEGGQVTATCAAQEAPAHDTIMGLYIHIYTHIYIYTYIYITMYMLYTHIYMYNHPEVDRIW